MPFNPLQFPGYKGLNLPWGTSARGEEVYSTWLTTGWDPAAAAADLDAASALSLRLIRAFLFLESFFVSPERSEASPPFDGFVPAYLANFNQWLDLCAARDLHPIVCFSDGTRRLTSDHTRAPGQGLFDHRVLFGPRPPDGSENLLPDPDLSADPFASGAWRAVSNDGASGPRDCRIWWEECSPAPTGARRCISLAGESGASPDGVAESQAFALDVNRCYAFSAWVKGHIFALRLAYYAADGVTPLPDGVVDREGYLTDSRDWINLNHSFDQWTHITVVSRYPEHFPEPARVPGGGVTVRVGARQTGAGLSGAIASPLLALLPAADASIRAPGWRGYLEAYQNLLNTTPIGAATPLRDDPRVFAWEVMNEPNDKLPGMGRTVVHGFLRDAFRAIRAVDARHPVSAEFASGAPDKGTGWVEAYGRDSSDFYQIHQYADPGPWNWPPADPRYLSKPTVLGEFGASNSNDGGLRHYLREDRQAETVQEVLSEAADRGYAAAIVWSLTDLGEGRPNNPLADHAPDGGHSLRAAGLALRDIPCAVVSDVQVHRSGESATITFHTDSPAQGQVAWASQAWRRRYASRLPDVAARFDAFPGKSPLSDSDPRVTEHNITVSGLDPGQRYFFAVRARLRDGV